MSHRLLLTQQPRKRFFNYYAVRSTATNSSSSLNFEDFANVYKFRSTGEIVRSYAILRICGLNFFVDNSLKVNGKFEINIKDNIDGFSVDEDSSNIFGIQNIQ